MGAPRLEAAMDVPGRLAYGCTDLTTAWPHGGTGLGFVDKAFLDFDHRVYPITAEEYGGEIVDEVAMGVNILIRAVLRDDDPDAVSQVALNSSAGATTGYRVWEWPGTNRAGYFYSARGTVVVFTPQSVIDGDDDQHDVIIFYNALPRLQDSLSIAHHAREERQYPLAFRAVRDGSDRLVKVGRRADLSI